MQQDFSISVSTVFAVLANHELFGQVVGSNIFCIKESDSEHPHGEGSVRKIQMPIGTFEETVIKFSPNQLIRYTVSKGSPIKDHLGELRFSTTPGGCRLDYTIVFTPKLPVWGWGKVLAWAIQRDIASGLASFSASPQQFLEKVQTEIHPAARHQ